MATLLTKRPRQYRKDMSPEQWARHRRITRMSYARRKQWLRNQSRKALKATWIERFTSDPEVASLLRTPTA